MNLKKIIVYTSSFIVLFIIGYNAATYFNQDKTIRKTRFLLGTIVEIQVRDLDEEKAEEVISEAFHKIERIDALLSTFDSKSPIWRFNNSTDTLIKMDPDIYLLINECLEISEITSGSFDITIDTLISLWGFGKEKMVVPDNNLLQQSLKASGEHNLILSDNFTIIRNNNVKLNFGAVAAGYAVDKAIEYLKNAKVKNALVNGGGEIRSIGDGWSIGIQHPRVPGALLEKIKLNGYSVATSGDYEMYFEENGIRYHHLLNPATGYPADKCQSVTIIAENTTMADALGTGVFVLGPEKGMALIESLENVEALIVDKNGRITKSSGFHKFLLR